MIATIKRKHFSVTKYALLVPFYWLCMSIAAWDALYKMIVSPHYWAKTIHGLHLKSPIVAQMKQNKTRRNISQTPVDISPDINPMVS
jgi:hypothetical protein